MKKQNAFWVAVAVAGAALLAALGYVMFVVRGEQDTLRRRNKGLSTELKTASVPGQPDIENWRKYRKGLIDSHTEIVKLYSQSDKRLERWLDGLGEDPSRGEFFERYRDEIRKLEGEVRKKKTIIGPAQPEEGRPLFGFNWEDPAEAMASLALDDQKRILRELQKRFWARQRVANIILNDCAQVTRVHDFRFFRRLSDKLPGGGAWEQVPSGAEAVTYPGAILGSTAGGEFDLPSDLGKTLTFGVALELPYSEVPKVISELLNAGSEKGGTERLLVNVVGTHVTLKSQNKLKEEIPYPEKEPKKLEELMAEKKKGVAPKDMMLTVTCQIIDFDPSKVKPFQQ